MSGGIVRRPRAPLGGSTRPPARLGAAASLAIASLAMAGCGGGDGGPSGPASFDGAPSAVVSSDAGHFRIELRTPAGESPTRGANDVELTVRDAATSAPRDGLVLDVVPWMTAMGHGTSVVPSVTARGDGRYLVSNVSLYMPGRWELRTHVTGALDDHAAPTIDVP